MIPNIKQLWDRMLPETKRGAVEALKAEFGLISTAFVRQTWIWGGSIPVDKQKKVLDLFVEIVRKQEKESLELILRTA